MVPTELCQYNQSINQCQLSAPDNVSGGEKEETERDMGLKWKTPPKKQNTECREILRLASASHKATLRIGG